MNPVDAYLDDKTLRQLTWKPTQCRDIAHAIVRRAVEGAGTLWPDEVELYVNDDDKNCIGLAWRTLASNGVIVATGSFRRSEHEARRGGKVFEYQLKSLALAKRWLAVNGFPAPQLREQQLAL